jgi:hypothetical protein
MLVQVLYLSEIAAPLSDTDLGVLLSAAQMRNRRLDVTGVLTRSSSYFAQVLEGREEAVDELIKRIARNVLHGNIRTVLRRRIQRRAFGGWSMGYLNREDVIDELKALYSCTASNADAEHFIHALQEELRWPSSA